jgi:hypothetical protein
MRVVVPSVIYARAFPALCGKGAANKVIPDVLLYHADERLLEAFLEGYLAGDGSRKRTRAGYEVRSFTTVSKLLALQLQLAFGRLGTFVSLRVERKERDGVILGRNVHMRETYSGSWCSDARATRRKRLHHPGGHDAYYLPVKSVRREPFSGTVHNFETEDHTYLVSNAIVGNCAGNCGIQYRDFFGTGGAYIGGGPNFPPSFSYAWFIQAVVAPAAASECPSPPTSCVYGPPSPGSPPPPPPTPGPSWWQAFVAWLEGIWAMLTGAPSKKGRR